ncbi:UDP-Glycosyltransferase/glycogen phosphorylase, partial [Aureobasidium melanogenum]
PGEEVQDSEDEMTVREAEKSFRNHFALPDSEKLVATFFGFFHRVLPLYGKLYVGSTRLCFRSFMPGNWTKLVVPFKDIMDVDKERGFRFGYSGMVVVIRGHEEIFFEFSSQDLRDDCTVTLLRSLDSLEPFQESVLLTEDEKRDAEAAAAENLLLQEARQGDRGGVEFQLPRGIDQPDNDSPAISFDDPAASVLNFKPEESLRITCLTIGSRGDVQPYIALCKGLLAEGHRPKIASHAEFGDWVRSHGIDFAPVEGNPAELMALCVDHGMFTPSFLYETNQKFWPFVRGLLRTAWAACQDSDLLIESPSAMAGIHIAEALG